MVIGTAVGMAGGLILGRWLWAPFAEELCAVPLASVPILLVGVGALGMANVVALRPAQHAARFPAALVLPAE